ncbi:bifunctional oligoribonuclease/PAP phosphatase NrnA [Candidatus Margulisiibacteriota bacterium]
MKSIYKAIKTAKKILVMGHTDPDGDAIGSMTSMYILLKNLKKKAVMYCPDEVPETYKFLPYSGKIKNKLSPKLKFDLGIAVDCGDIKRLGSKINVRKMVKTLVNIDHHPDNTKFGDINYIRSISSVSEIMYGLFNFCAQPIDKRAATSLYVGIMTDTGNFRYDYTTSDTLRIAADLVDDGANISGLAMKVYETKTMSAMKVLGAAMYGVKCSKSGRVAWSALTSDLMAATGARSEDLTGIVDAIRSIRGVEVAVLFREVEDGIKVNFRSKYKINVSAIAKKLGGGGHVRASGVMIKGDIDEVQQKVLKEVFKVIK